MELYKIGRYLHLAVGVATLVTFWVAAFARKGGIVHRRAGASYLVCLIGILASSGVMLAGRLSVGDSSTAASIVILMVFLGTTIWLAWTSVRPKQSFEMLTGPTYRVLASLNLVAALFMVVVFAATRAPVLLVLSSVGFTTGFVMWRLVLRGPRNPSWRIEQHMNAAAVNFSATHDSFLALAVGSVIPALRAPWPRAIICGAILSLALLLRIGLGRRYRQAAGPNAPPVPVMLASGG
jgi:hypothetical protein